MPYSPYYYGFDSTYIFVLIGVVISLLASAKVKTTFSKYSKIRSNSGMTGADAARRLLNSQGISSVRIERISGQLNDHYDPRTKTLRLSDATYGSSSVAAIGVAAHECGHAIQDAQGYAALRFRGALVPVANFGSKISWILIFAGLFISGQSSSLLINAGIFMFSLAVLFQLVTLPVEFNASRRAVLLLDQTGVLYGDEIKHTKKVLSAAALTYVAAAAASILQLLRLILLFGGRRRD